MAIITKVEQTVPTIKAKKKVAAYARVSTESERMHHSLSAQISYYSALIQKNPDWEYAGVFADDGISGTSIEKRDEFKRMLTAAENGDINIILTKSIQRFARNTVDLLETVRHLKDIGVEIQFEKEHISSMSGDGELMLTILASFAQEESISQSHNIKWSKAKTARDGNMTNTSVPYGYRFDFNLGIPVIIPEQADVVRMIYNDYVYGKMTVYQIAKKLNEQCIKPQRGDTWGQCVVRRLMQNVTYTGNMLLGKTYTENPLTHKRNLNRGELQRYFVENTHEAIIDQETFDLAQAEIKRCSELGRLANPHITYNHFTGKIICTECGRPFGRVTNRLASGKVPAWSCKKPGGKCPTPIILESEMENISASILDAGDFVPETFTENIELVMVDTSDLMTFIFKDGSRKTYQFIRRRKSTLEARRKNCGKESNNNTTDNQPLHGNTDKQHC